MQSLFCKYSDDSSQCTAKASLEKASSWPPEQTSFSPVFFNGRADVLYICFDFSIPIFWHVTTNHPMLATNQRKNEVCFRGHTGWILAYQGTCIDPPHQSHPLDPALKDTFQKIVPAIWLLTKDLHNPFVKVFNRSKQLVFESGIILFSVQVLHQQCVEVVLYPRGRIPLAMWYTLIAYSSVRSSIDHPYMLPGTYGKEILSVTNNIPVKQC